MSSFFEYRADARNYIPKLQSHRGFRNTPNPIRENTLESIRKSYELGYEMVEFDVRLTRDRKVVLFHDETIQGKQVSRLTLKNLRLKENVDLLEDVLVWFVESKIKNFKLNIEIKSKVLNGILEKEVFKLISRYKLNHEILISSFNPISLAYFRSFDAKIFRSLLLTNEKHPGNNFFIQKMVFNTLCRPNALHLREDDWEMKYFNELLSRKIPIVLWTCNDLSKMNTYFNQGITGVISDQITPIELQKQLIL